MKYQREMLKAVSAYVPGEQPKPGERIIKLNTNENPYPPSPRVMEAIAALGADGLRRYPDPFSLELRSVAATLYGFAGPEWAIAGNGSDELLAMIIRTFADPGDVVLSAYPTYTLYETLAKLHGAKFEGVDLADDFQLTPEAFTRKGRIVQTSSLAQSQHARTELVQLTQHERVVDFELSALRREQRERFLAVAVERRRLRYRTRNRWRHRR